MTAQIQERLILDGQEVFMAFCPPLPGGHPRIYAGSGEASEKSEEVGDELCDLILRSTACWRGYQGTWEIRDGRFYLVGLRGRLKLREGQPILADWFSGVLRVPQGELLRYVHMGFGSVYERELHISIDKGLVVSTDVILNPPKDHDGGRSLYDMANTEQAAFALHVSDKLRADSALMAQVQNNTMEQAMKADLPTKAISAIAAAMNSHTSMATKLLSDESTRDVFLTVVYELLKKDDGADLPQGARG